MNVNFTPQNNSFKASANLSKAGEEVAKSKIELLSHLNEAMASAIKRNAEKGSFTRLSCSSKTDVYIKNVPDASKTGEYRDDLVVIGRRDHNDIGQFEFVGAKNMPAKLNKLMALFQKTDAGDPYSII